MTTEERYIQFRKESENALVSIALNNPRAAIDAVMTVVEPSDFSDKDLGELYEVLQDLHQSGFKIEQRAVFLEMEKRGVIDRIGRHEISQLAKLGYLPSNARKYAENVARLANHQRLVNAAEQIIATKHLVNSEPGDILSRFESESQIKLSTEESSTLDECIGQMYDQHLSAKHGGGSIGMRTGFQMLDRVTTGIHPGQLWLIGARTNVGKTAFSLSLCNSLASGATGQNRGVVFFSMEMTKTEIAERVISDQLGIPYSTICNTQLTHDQLQQIERCREDFKKWPFVVTDQPSQTVADIKAKAKLFAPKSGLDVVVVDTLQQVRPSKRQERRLELQQIANDLKNMAKELDCAVIVCTQLNADAENREPNLTHLSEGKQIIEPVDTALLLHRPDRNRPEVQVKAEKLRRGRRVAFSLNFNGAFQRFTDPSDEASVNADEQNYLSSAASAATQNDFAGWIPS